jgi:hypothetical protein
MAGSFASFFEQTLWPKLELPLAEIIVHLAVTVLSVLSIAAIELLLYLLGLDGKEIPGTGVKLSDWMLVLEVLAATAIIVIGIAKAVIALWKKS